MEQRKVGHSGRVSRREKPDSELSQRSEQKGPVVKARSYYSVFSTCLDRGPTSGTNTGEPESAKGVSSLGAGPNSPSDQSRAEQKQVDVPREKGRDHGLGGEEDLRSGDAVLEQLARSSCQCTASLFASAAMSAEVIMTSNVGAEAQRREVCTSSTRRGTYNRTASTMALSEPFRR